jgi:hypothetical protein
MTISFSIKKLFPVIAFSAVAAMIIGPEYSWISSIATTQPANATTQFSFTLHRNNQLNPFGNLNSSSNPNQFNVPSNVNPFPNLPSPPSSPSTSSLSQSQNPYPYQNQPFSSLPATPQSSSSSLSQSQNPYPYQYPYSYGYQNQPSSSLPATQGPSSPLSQSQNQYPYTNQQQQQPASTATNNAGVPSSSSQSPYPYQQQQPQQQQNQASSSLTNASHYPYQRLQQTQPSQSVPAAQRSVSTLIIVTHVNSTAETNNNVNAAPAAVSNYTQAVENAFTNPDGYTYVYHYMKESQAGVTLNLQPGIFAVYELTGNNVKTNYPPLSQSAYDITYSGGCKTLKSNTVATTYGYGTINVGETKTCTVTLSSHK